MSYLGRSAKLSLKAQEKVSFLATAGQTSKTGLSYTPSFIEVYVNGVLLTDTTDFTATNGNSITFTVALLLNDEVTVISLKTFTVADHYSKTEADTLLAAKATNTALALKAPIASPSFTGGIGVTGAVNSTGEMRITNPSATSQLYLYGAAGQKANIILNEYGVRAWNIGAGTFTSGQFSISDGSTEHMRIDQAGHAIIGGGVTLGNGQTYAAANTLDDYEEGTFTPSGTGVNTSSSVGIYTKIGRVCHVQIWIEANGTTAGHLAGLPFASGVGNVNYLAVGSVGFQNGTVNSIMTTSGVGFYMYTSSNTQGVLTNGQQLHCSLTYITT